MSCNLDLSGGCCPTGSFGFRPQPNVPLAGKDVQLPVADNRHNADLQPLDAYVTGDQNSKKAVLIFSDVYGFASGNHREICDWLARQGYFVVMPDFFRGNPPFVEGISTEEGLHNVGRNFSFTQIERDIVQIALPFVKGDNDRTVASLGFCYGAYLFVHIMAKLPEALACAASPHPSVHKMSNIFKEDYLQLISQLRKPIMLLNASNDPQEQGKGGVIEATLSESVRSKSVFETYPEMTHGWTTRGDREDPATSRDIMKVLVSVKEFFEANF